MKNNIDKNELIRICKLLATPIDYEKLEKDGILEKKGAWYKVKVSKKKLPEYISRQAKAMMSNKGDFLIKLPKSWKKAQQIYKKMSGKEFNSLD